MGEVWCVRTGARQKGCNGSFKIDRRSGEILFAVFAPL
jgi:hypothetical protein